MRSPDIERLELALRNLDEAIGDADPRMRARAEWKRAAEWRRALGEPAPVGDGGIDDAVRQAEAHSDLLALARAEEAQRAIAEERTRQERLREDESLLAAIERELKVYAGLIALSFVLPFVLLPFGPWLLLGALPSIGGLVRMFRVTSSVSGRGWLILRDRVDQPLRMARFCHWIAAASWPLALAWFAFAMIREGAAG